MGSLTPLTKQELRDKFKKKTTPIGKILFYTGAARIYNDGDGLDVLYRWYHPLTWVMFLIMFPICAVVGERIGNVIPIFLSEYWQARKDKIQWV